VAGVFIEAEGRSEAIDEFLCALRADAPPLATVDEVASQPMPGTGQTEFSIVASVTGGERASAVTTDSATCDDCLAEMRDPENRRHGYAFINCTNCGPRFTITRDVPYDRPFTTMAGFTMCDSCAGEYRDPANRRFHAQPTCCPTCGPQLSLVDADGEPLGGEPIRVAADLLNHGAIVAIKGLGGYHLAADAADETAAALLRSRKHREDKPFAVMVASLESARELCVVDSAAQSLLSDRRRPIVLLDRRPGIGAWRGVAGSVAPGNRAIGMMLPYTPIHHLLLDRVTGPIILTSGNVSDEPIAYDDADALTRLGAIADAFLIHNRPIHMRVDDSVVRAHEGRPVVIRRARGYAPEPMRVAEPAGRPILACGAELKNTFCLLKGANAIISQHIGDLENLATLRSYADGIAHFERIFDAKPQVIAHDMHPDYLSTKYAADRAEADDSRLVEVQHHHAHIVSCLADNGESGPVIGVAFDGTGYGPDGTIWGGEFLLADLVSYRRIGHLAPVPLPGGAAAIRQPWRMAASYLEAAYGDAVPDLAVMRRNSATWPAIVSMARARVNAPMTSSAGRLFDAMSAILGVRDAVNYEGQAAIELEQRTDVSEPGRYPMTLRAGDAVVVESVDLIRAAVDDLAKGVSRAVIAARFHNGLASAVVGVCTVLRDRTGVSAVALSGGVFQNMLLLDHTAGALDERGFRVLTHGRVPPNDGGISLGQAMVAAARDRVSAR
jgi:hydrogenase maturation protein HypF